MAEAKDPNSKPLRLKHTRFSDESLESMAEKHLINDAIPPENFEEEMAKLQRDDDDDRRFL